jgi:ketosteroid isomerase-like protein
MAGYQQNVQADSRATQAQDIQDEQSLFLKAFNKKDAVGVAAVYTDDAVLMPPNLEAVAGHTGIQFFMAKEFTLSISGMLMNTPEVVALDDYGFTRGSYTLLDDKGATLDHGKFLEIWKHTDQGWRIFRDIYNSDLPPPQPPAAPAPATPAPAATTGHP